MRYFLSTLTRCLVLFSLPGLAGCNPDNPTTGTTQVSGQVVQRQSRQPVGNGTVQVQLRSSAGGYRPVGDPQPCDGQGRFAFAFDAESKFGYLLMAQAPPGYITDWAEAPELTAGRKNKEVVVPVLAPAWVRLLLVDEPALNTSSIHLSGYDGPGDRLNFPRETTLIRPALADFPRKVIWVLTSEKGVDIQFEQEVKLSPLDTVTVRIPF